MADDWFNPGSLLTIDKVTEFSFNTGASTIGLDDASGHDAWF
jgi:hypothetical protein